MMNRKKKLSLATSSRRGLAWTTAATPAVMSRPTNIHRNAWDRNAVASRASGRTPRVAGEVVTPGASGFAGVVGATGVDDVRYGLGNWFWLIERCPPGILGQPHEAGVARVPALGQQGHFHVVLDDRLGLFLDLRDHGARVRSEGGCQDHLD